MTETEILRQVPLFTRMKDDELAELVRVMDRREFEPGSTILQEGDPGDYLYVIVSGTVQFIIHDASGNEMILDEAGAGDFFGELSMITGEPRNASVRAQEPVVAMGLGHAVFFDMLQEHPNASLELLTIIGRRLHRTDKLLRQTVSRNVNEIVAERTTFGQWLADRFAMLSGSWTFIIVQSSILAAWIFCNVLFPTKDSGQSVHQWDPYPFIFLNLMLSFQAAYAAPIIMMSQNRSGLKDRVAAEVDHEVNVKAEVKTGLILSRLDDIERALGRLARAR